jgi:hypothetical protein
MHRCRFVVPLLLALGLVLGAAASFAQVGIGLSITIAPPLLPVYVQPPIPTPGYIWTPGYWAYGPYGYFWVPGTWVQPPAVGLLWTPGYWGWNNGVYAFNQGYWGPHVGFYGGINYGFGYGGVGYQGGYWNNGAFNYNRAVNNIGNTHITNVYNRTVVNNTTVNNVSYNGGNGGTVARPTPQEQALAPAQRLPPTQTQIAHQQAASTNHALLASVNQGHPPIAATTRPGVFSGPGVVPAHNAVAPVRAGVAPGPANPALRGAAAEHAGVAPGLAIPGQHVPEATRPAIAGQHGVAPASLGASPALRTPAEAGHPVSPGEVPARPAARVPAAQGLVPPQAHVAPQVHPVPVHPVVARLVHPAPVHAAAARPVPHPAPAPHRPVPQHEEKKPPPG